MAEIAIAAAVSAAISAASYTLNYVLQPKPKAQERGRLQGELQVQDSTYGPMIPVLYGSDPTFTGISPQHRHGQYDDSDTAPKPTGLAVGDLMLAFCWRSNAISPVPAPTPPAGWTLITSVENVDPHNTHQAAFLFRKFADSVDVAATDFTFTNADFTGVVAYSGVDSTTPIEAFDEVSYAEPAGTLTAVLPSLVALGVNRRSVYFVSTCSVAPTHAPPTGYTERVDGFGDSLGDRVFAESGSTGTQTVTITPNGHGGPVGALGIHLLLKPAISADVSGGGNTVAGNVIYLAPVRPVVTSTTSGGGKGGGPTQITKSITYYTDIVVKFAEGRQLLQKLFADAEPLLDLTGASAATGLVDGSAPAEPAQTDYLLPPDPSDPDIGTRGVARYAEAAAYDSNGVLSGTLKDGSSFRFYQGTETQPADPLLEAYFQSLFPTQHAAGKVVTPTHKGDCYLAIENFNISNYGRIPSLRAKLSNADHYAADTIAADLAERVGLESGDLSLTAVVGLHVRGLPVFNRDGAAEAISTLQLIHAFDLVDSDGELEAVLRGGAVEGLVDYDDLGATDGEQQESDQPSRSESEINVDLSSLPQRIDLSYFEAGRDGETGSVGWSRLETDAKSVTPQELNAVLRKDEAERVVRRLLDTVWAEARASRRFNVPHTYYGLKPGAAWNVPTSQTTSERVRLTEVNGFLPGAFECKGVVESSRGHTQTQIVITGTASEAAGDVAGSGGRPPTLSAPNTSVACFIDRIIRDRERTDGKPGFYVGARGFSAGAWGGATIKRDKGFGFERVAELSTPATLGVAVTVPATLLTGSTPTIDLYEGGTLPSYTTAEVAAGAGYVIIGHLIFQYETATQLSTSPNRWQLSTLSNIGAICSTNGGLAAGQRFALLNDAFRFVAVESDEIGVEYDFIAQSSGQNEADCAVIPFICAAPDFDVTTPADFNLTAGAGEINATWTPVSAGACKVIDGITYEIRLTTPGGTLLFEGNASSFRLTGLAAGSYTWQFRAKTKYKNGSWIADSATVTTTTALVATGADQQRAVSVPSVSQIDFYNSHVENLTGGAVAVSPAQAVTQNEWIYALYFGALGAGHPDAGELSAAQGRLNARNGNWPAYLKALKDEATSLYTGGAYTALSTSDSQFIKDLYEGCFGRPVDVADQGYLFWLPQLLTQGGSLTRAQLIAQFIAAVEYLNRGRLVYGFTDEAGSVNAQTGTTYTLLPGDRGKLVSISNASAHTLTLPDPAATAGFTAEYWLDLQCVGAGGVTLSPAAAKTIDGAASLAITQAQGLRLYTDGVNWFTMRGMATGGGGGGSVTRYLYFEFDGRGAVLDPLTAKQAVLPFSPAGTISEIYIKDLDDIAGTCEIDVRKAARGSAPPGSGESICGGSSNRPKTTAQSEATKTSFTGWTTTSVAANDEVRLVIISNSSHKHLLVTVTLTP